MNSPFIKNLLVLLIVTSLLVISPATFAQEPDPNTPEPASSSASINLYLPAILRTLDLTVDLVETTQAVQTNTNSVTLVANRMTAARIYVSTNSADGLTGVNVTVSAYQGATQLPSSPLILAPGNVSSSWSRADINSSFNTLLPSSWLSGNVTLYVTVDPSDAIDEQNETNNTVTKTMQFTEVPDLEIKVVPIRYTHTPTGKTYPPPSASFIKAAFERFYPVGAVNLTVRSEAYNFAGDLSKYGSWSRLLDNITSMKVLDEAPASQVFYGLIPLLDNNGYTWWYGGYAGLGWIGHREAIGLTDAYLKQFNYTFDGKQAANHEVGHNFGRDHAPCGDAGDIDSTYPYAGGIIGQYGFDLSQWKVIPTSYKDIMGYCSPIWVSDYTYLGLLQNQLDFGEPAKILNSTESLYVRADMNDDGTANLQPVYTISAPPDETPAESEFSLEFVNDAGETVATYPVAARLAKGEDFQAHSIHVITPKPALPYSSISLIKNGVTIGERTLPQSSLNKTAQPAVYVENGEFVLNWGTPQTPALVRYTSDQGESWTTLGVDILEGELRMDPQLLPIGTLLFEIRLADTTDSIMNITWEHLP